MNVFWCGTDISKKKLDSAIAASKEGKHRSIQVDNAIQVYQNLLRYLPERLR